MQKGERCGVAKLRDVRIMLTVYYYGDLWAMSTYIERHLHRDVVG